MSASVHSPQPLGKWFWPAASGVLLFMLVGVAGYLATVMTPLEQVPLEQRAVMEAMPGWQTWVYALAVWTGLAGAILLLLRRRWSVPLLGVSLVCAIGTFLPFAIVPPVRELATRGDGIAAIIVIGLCLISFWFARHSRERGWLR
jgi:hypothetical protein